MFDLSAFGAESARHFSSGLTANPELLLPNNIHAPRMLKDRRALLILGADAGDALYPHLDITEFATLAEPRNLQPVSCSFLQSLKCDQI